MDDKLFTTTIILHLESVFIWKVYLLARYNAAESSECKYNLVSMKCIRQTMAIFYYMMLGINLQMRQNKSASAGTR